MRQAKDAVYNIVDYGASPEADINTKAIQEAIDVAHLNGGGEVVVPAGTFVTGAIFLKSNICLYLSTGATLRFSDQQQDYPVVTSRWEGVQQPVYASCVYAENQQNIAVMGLGTLDGNGVAWWQTFRNTPAELAYPRPKLVGFHNCKRVTVRDVRLIDSPSWTVHPLLCENVTIDNISIENSADSPNTDGIDPESCRNVRISNCHIDVGDDCIAIKSGTEGTAERVACENVTIDSCTMVHGHGGVVFGSEMSGDIRNVTIANCVFKHTDRGLRFKSRRGRGGTVEDIRVTNLVMDQVVCPFIINSYYFWGPKGDEAYVWDKKPRPVTEETPTFRNIHFANITAKNVHAAAGFIYGLAEKYTSGITFTDIRIRMADEAVPGEPAMMMGIEKMVNRGFLVTFAEEVLFQRVTVENHKGAAFVVNHSGTVELDRCRSQEWGTETIQILPGI